MRAKSPSKQKAAWVAVAEAVRSGALAAPTTLPCVTCGGAAAVYHHDHGYDGDNRLNVVAVCHPCHKLRPHVGRDAVPRFTIELRTMGERVLMHQVKVDAARAGVPMREWALEAFREKLERDA